MCIYFFPPTHMQLYRLSFYILIKWIGDCDAESGLLPVIVWLQCGFYKSMVFIILNKNRTLVRK